MIRRFLPRAGMAVATLILLALLSASVWSDATYTAGTPPIIGQAPLYMRDAVPPLNMLVMGKDHKNYYEAYNDASDLDGDGALDVGYRGWVLKSPAPPAGQSPYKIDYYGYFNSFACYSWDSANNRFNPVSSTANKQCSGQWSGDFLNYLTTSRMDAMRRVLYGGWRQVDTATVTVLQGAFFPQDAHSWGKEYQSTESYDISNYAPLSIPAAGKNHLFAVTTTSNNTAPKLRVMQSASIRVWNWLSIEGPVAGNSCFSTDNIRFDCLVGIVWQVFPAKYMSGLTTTTWKHGGSMPTTTAEMNTKFTNSATNPNRCGAGNVATINKTADGNPYKVTNNCGDDNYISRTVGNIVIPTGEGGNYTFAIDGDDAVDLYIDGTLVVGWYGGHGNDRSTGGLTSHSATVNLSVGTHTLIFRHVEGSGGDNWGLFWKHETPPASRRDDYAVRVLSCPDTPAAARESTCKAYPNGHFKPTGILHDYGETQKMYFGLITGSQRNNLEGGVLRRNVSDFASEINATTGVFDTSVDGIVRNIDKLRMIGGGYGGGVTDNSAGDTNWNWANTAHGVGGNCVSQGDRALNNGECRMWGNPIAEMMFESMRYFAGAAAATARFATSGGSTEGTAEDTALALSTPAWKDPYKSTANGGLGYPTCAKPYETVISDINPSYDGDLPGSAFASITADTTVSGFSASTEGNAIWTAEYGGARSVFIGEVNGVTDDAPTPKTASTFANIRGLSPEEPTKGGTYYSASVARYGRNNDLNTATETQNLSTYSIALASPLPTIRFPVGGRVVTLLPFAKTPSGTFGGGTRKPTNTIVDFYVQKIVNMPGAPSESGAPSDGRAYAVFRINYEDVEQGNDHDMDAIVVYEIKETATGAVEVKLTSEYAAGSADQNIGYSISGTTQDGIYLDVRDTDSTAGTFVPYNLNTPNPTLPGGCNGVTTGLCGAQLPLVSTRTFTPGGTQTTLQLKNPLWYAAKYGAPGWPIWDQNADLEPDNYFLVTNPLYLRAQLSKAFDDIASRDIDVGSASISGARVGSSSFTLQPTFRRERNGKDWTGNLSALAIDPVNGALIATPIWHAQAKLPPSAGATTPANRNIRTVTTPGDNSAKVAADFQAANLGANNNARLTKLGINPVTIADAAQYGTTYTADDMVAYLRGDQTREASVGGTTNTLRTRSSVLGDIVNSEPVIASPKSDFGYGSYGDSMFAGYSGASGYVAQKVSSGRKTVAYVGANDGMLHAFDASSQPCASPNQRLTCATTASGTEMFAFIPNAALGSLGQLALPDSNFNHRYYVDGQLTIGDAKDGSTWKTLLVGAMAAGGQSIYALDVSNPQSFGNNQVLWERNRSVDMDIGNIYGKPLLLPLENGSWGVVFGNGYGGNRSDPSLYILDAFSGALIRKITASDGNPASDTLSPVADFICSVLPLGEFCARKVDPFNGLGQITAIDSDGDGKADTVYGGDLQGNMWKFDLSASTASGWNVAFSGAPLFTAVTGTERQPITGGIRIATGPGSGYMIYFGTGRYFVNGDNNVPATPQVQSLYAVWDNGTAAGGRTNLTAQTITSEQVVVDNGGTPSNPADDTSHTVRNISRNMVAYYGSAAKRGWFLDLKTGTTGIGERFIATPRVQSGRIFFTTYTPTANSCSPGGLNFAYGLDLLSGAGAISNVSVLPSKAPACTGSDCGAVAVSSESGTTQPPVMGTGAAAINPVTELCPVGGPVTAQCPAPGGPSFEQCQVVIYPGAFVLPRPCGRQSWRQLR